MVADYEPMGEREGKSQGPVRVPDLLLSDHALAAFGMKFDPLELVEWRYLEVVAWTASRDFAVLSGFQERSGPGSECGASLSSLTVSVNGSPALSFEIIDKARLNLNQLLCQGKLSAYGSRNGEKIERIPRTAWDAGTFSRQDGGTWWEGQIHCSSSWTQLVIPTNTVLEHFPSTEMPLAVLPPTDAAAWVPLTAALMWIHFRHSIDFETLNSPPLNMLGQSYHHVRYVLERAWRKLANYSSAGLVTVRGRPFDGSQTRGDEIDLTRDDLLNCKWFDWAVGDQDTQFVAAVYRFKPDDDFAVLQHGFVNFSFVRVDRDALLRLWPIHPPEGSMGVDLSQQMSPVSHANFGSMVPIAGARSRAGDAMRNAAGGDEATRMPSPDAGTAKLKELLMSGEVQAVVVKADGMLWCIPSAYWASNHGSRSLEASGFVSHSSHGELAHGMNGLGVFVARADLNSALKVAAITAATTVAAVKRMTSWLEERLDSSSPDVLTRGQIMAEAIEKFDVSANAFNTAWKTVTADGRSQWNRGGRKPRILKG